MNLGFAAHIVLAGATMYALAPGAARRAGPGRWSAGCAYELTGHRRLAGPAGTRRQALRVGAGAAGVAGAAPGHPRPAALAATACWRSTVGLCMLSPHYQMTYYLLVAAGLWTLYLVLLRSGAARRARAGRWSSALAFGAVLLGLAIAAIQVLPFLAVHPVLAARRRRAERRAGITPPASRCRPRSLSPRFCPQFNGVLDGYWGRNFFKLHTEYLGAVVVVLAALGLGRPERGGGWCSALGVIALLFLLVAFGGHTPFYRLWYEVMPMMKKVRAPGMAFFLVALPVAAFAGFGAERLLARRGRRGALWSCRSASSGSRAARRRRRAAVAWRRCSPRRSRRARVAANAGALQGGRVRLLVVVLAGRRRCSGAVCERAASRSRAPPRRSRAGRRGRPLEHRPAVLRLPRRRPRSSSRDDPGHDQASRPSRNPSGCSMPGCIRARYLMAHDIQTVLGYHGNEIRFYDELLGGKSAVAQRGQPERCMDLLAVRYLLLPERADGARLPPGARARSTTTPGRAGASSTSVIRCRAYVRVVPGAAKLPEDQARADRHRPAVPVSAGRPATRIRASRPTPDPARAAARARRRSGATLAEWAPGRMRDHARGHGPTPALSAGRPRTGILTGTPTVDGKPAPVLRADHTLLSVVLPPGAREVRLDFASDGLSREGKLVTLLALLLTAGVAGLARSWPRRSAAHG